MGICFANYQAFAEVQNLAAERDPTLFGGQRKPTSTPYGSVGNGDAGPKPDLTEEEREELKAHVMASGSRLSSKCCSQGFFLLVVFLFFAKLQGAGFSSMWIISPILFVIGIILCCLGCAIFGITEVPTDGLEFDTGEYSADLNSTTATDITSINPPQTSQNAPQYIAPTLLPGPVELPERDWDPEKGELRRSFIESNTNQTEKPPEIIPP